MHDRDRNEITELTWAEIGNKYLEKKAHVYIMGLDSFILIKKKKITIGLDWSSNNHL